jgi:hypothetical protein
MITTASDEMQFVRAVITPGMVRHKANLRVAARKSRDIRPSRPHLYKKRKGGPATNSEHALLNGEIRKIGGGLGF